MYVSKDNAILATITKDVLRTKVVHVNYTAYIVDIVGRRYIERTLVVDQLAAAYLIMRKMKAKLYDGELDLGIVIGVAMRLQVADIKRMTRKQIWAQYVRQRAAIRRNYMHKMACSGWPVKVYDKKFEKLTLIKNVARLPRVYKDNVVTADLVEALKGL